MRPSPSKETIHLPWPWARPRSKLFIGDSDSGGYPSWLDTNDEWFLLTKQLVNVLHLVDKWTDRPSAGHGTYYRHCWWKTSQSVPSATAACCCLRYCIEFYKSETIYQFIFPRHRDIMWGRNVDNSDAWRIRRSRWWKENIGCRINYF